MTSYKELKRRIKWAGVPQLIMVIIIGIFGIIVLGWPIWVDLYNWIIV
jgi:hypothetical protein